MTSPQLSLVVPVFNEEGNLPEFLRRARAALGEATQDFEILLCADPSRDRTEEIAREAHASDPRVKLLVFSRRVGQPMATLAGLEKARGAAVIVMDADLQDPPELLPVLVARWREGHDVVLPQRRSRTGEPWLKRQVAALGYRVMQRTAEVAIPPNTGDFRLMSRRVVDEVLRLRESHGFLRGLVALVGFEPCLVPFDRPPRHAGRTNYHPLIGSVRIGLNGLFCFSRVALQASTWTGFVLIALSGALLAARIGAALLGHSWAEELPGVALLVLLVGGVQLVSVGILGEYVARIYDEVRRRPRAIVARSVGFE